MGFVVDLQTFVLPKQTTFSILTLFLCFMCGMCFLYMFYFLMFIKAVCCCCCCWFLNSSLEIPILHLRATRFPKTVNLTQS